MLLLLHLGGLFSILDQQNIRGKMIRNRGWDKTAQTKGVGGRRGFIEAINVCVREKGSRHTKYHVIESYRVLELKREWKMFATKKVMKQRKSQGFLLLSGNSSNPFGNSRKKRIRDNYLQYLRRVHLLAKRFSSKRMAKNQVQNSSNPKEKNWGKWEVSEARRTECAKLNPSKPN